MVTHLCNCKEGSGIEVHGPLQVCIRDLTEFIEQGTFPEVVKLQLKSEGWEELDKEVKKNVLARGPTYVKGLWWRGEQAVARWL